MKIRAMSACVGFHKEKITKQVLLKLSSRGCPGVNPNSIYITQHILLMGSEVFRTKYSCWFYHV